MTTNVESDLRTRWLPSAEQMRAANALLASGYEAERPPHRERGVFTGHLLVNKTWGIWTTDVELVFLDGVFTDREALFAYVTDAARRHHERTGKTVIGGYAWHMDTDRAAVWDLIGSEFPRRAS